LLQFSALRFRETKSQLLRIGHMGYNANLTNIMATLAPLDRTMDDIEKKKTIVVPTK
jgi:aspartate aminotransferase-like enzyme